MPFLKKTRLMHLASLLTVEQFHLAGAFIKNIRSYRYRLLKKKGSKIVKLTKMRYLCINKTFSHLIY